MQSRVKEKLRTAELTVSGDQWLIFLYQGYHYDPEDPWNGLFRGPILISVCDLLFFENLRPNLTAPRPINISSLLQVLSIRSPRLLVRAMLVSMG